MLGLARAKTAASGTVTATSATSNSTATESTQWLLNKVKSTNHITKEQISFHMQKGNNTADIGAHVLDNIKGGTEDTI